MANLYTKQGDKGKTSLYGGSRTDKDNLRVGVYGTVDEANSMMGLAYAQSQWENIKTYIKDIQVRMFTLGAELASDEAGRKKLQEKITQKDVVFLEKLIDNCSKINGKQESFVIPGVNGASAALHVARTIIRRGERSLVALSRTEEVRDTLLQYMNRLSDAVYALARLEETMVSIQDTVETSLENKSSTISYGGTKTMTLQDARELVRYGEEKAAALGVPIVSAVVDHTGTVMLHDRMDHALAASLDISAGKAYTAYAFKMPTHELHDMVQPGGSLYGVEHSNQGKIVSFGGGYPLIVNHEIIGAIGISGGTVQEDMIIGTYAVEKFLSRNGGKK